MAGRSRQAARGVASALVVVAGLSASGSAQPRGWPPAATIPVAGEAAILSHQPASTWTVFRFDQDPQVLVIDFASLRIQGRMLNRVAALVEKLAAPHDHVLDDDALRSFIRASGQTEETFYYGHDYEATALARFFRLAAREHVVLDPQEQALRAILAGQGWLKPGAIGAVISIPAVNPRSQVTLRLRAAILHHELAHGAYFTRPEYANEIRGFWRSGLDDRERAAFQAFLTRDGYDPALQDLTINEMQAYLGFTPDPEVFNAAVLGVSEAKLETLRARLLASIRPGWPRPPPLPRAPLGACSTTGRTDGPRRAPTSEGHQPDRDHQARRHA